jgi:UDP-GlcNAc:undecaprenyl-phosphate GlcNAc-1-phosphate transferase
VPLTVLWILGATNALNWLDNMDGLVGGVAAIASGMFLVLAVPTGSAIPVLLAVTLLGVSLGFLAHNFPPARVFMGDCGSGFLGFTLAATATLGSSRDVANVLLALLIPGLVLAVPIFDTLTVTWLRARHGRSILQGGRDHPSHRLVAMGLSERRAVLLLYMLSALSGGVGILAWHLGALPGLVVTAVLALGFGALGVVLAEVRTYGDEPPPHQATVLPGPIMHKRWLVSMILDLVLLCVAFAAAHLLRFEGQVPDHVAAAAAQALPIMLVAKMAVLYGLGIYRGTWRYVGILDLIRLGQAASLGSLAATAALFFMTKAEGLSRAALVLDWVLTVGLLASGRMAIRGVREYLVAHRQSGQRVLIVGSGEGGALLARALRQMPGLGYLPVGHLTCGPAVAEGAVMNGLPVLGSHANIDEVLREHRVEAVVLVPSELNGAERRIRDACDQAGIPVKRMGRLIE